MKQRIQNLLKYRKGFYALYYHLMSFFIRLMGMFCRTDPRLILINSFAGRKYDDSPRAIFEQMKSDPRFSGMRLVWAFHKPEQYEVEGAEKIKTDSLSYFLTALRARVWVTNSSVERGLRFKKKKTFYLNTWHGTPLKKMGNDLQTENQSFKSKGKSNVDIMMSQGAYETEIFARAFGIPSTRFLEAGLPRNDILAKADEKLRQSIREQLGIGEDQCVILYCPTFREYEQDEHRAVVMAPPMNLTKWEQKLGQRFVLFFRAHYEVSKVMKVEENAFVRNMTSYPSLNDLIIASDLLISDYSSVFFDYAITGKPMLHFTYDYDQYASKRGMYFDIRQYLNGSADEDSLLEILLTLSENEERARSTRFRDAFVGQYGHAAEAAVNCIADSTGIGRAVS